MSADPDQHPSSRQDLVVPPRQSSLPLVLGSLACAAAGFGLVWAVGLGRAHRGPPLTAHAAAETDAADAPADAASATVRTVGSDADPDLLPSGGGGFPIQQPEGEPRAAGGWRQPSPADPPDDRYALPVSLDVPDAVGPSTEHLEIPGRFEPVEPRLQEPPPVGTPTDAFQTSGGETETADDAPTPPDDPDIAPSGTRDAGRDSRSADAPTAAAQSAVETTADSRGVGEPTEAPQAEPATPASATLGAAPAWVQPAPAVIQQPEVPVGRPTPPQPFPSPPPAARVAPAPSPPSVGALVSTGAPPSAAVAAGVPFATAPPIMPGVAPIDAPGIPPADPSARMPDDPPPDGVAQGTTGQGRPGPIQLEGVQTPQVSVEKRGPREIQVGKPARYEIVVRNVGSATAHDVTLRDSVPHGTALVTTTPPASPVITASGADEGALVWSLGTLAPGGQAVVMMEVMPQLEGEIGSVASVSFRADATARSRSTKPDLKIDCPTPDPVLIGRDLQVTITVSNPGTGIATGVVLEGFLPDNVSHRSGRELEFDVGQLQPGESKTIDLVLGTRGPGLHQARLSARADGGVEIAHDVPIEVTAPTLELAVDMPLRRFLQRPATCTIAMVNAGTAPARAIELAAQLPPGLKFVRANNAGWHDERTHRVLWNLEELPAGETGSVEVVVMPIELGPQKILAAARSADGLAHQAFQVCNVEGLAALVFEVADSEDPIEVEGVTEYVVRVGNQGTKPATGVRLVATLLGDMEPVEASGPAGHRVENLTIAFDPLAKLAPSEEAVFRIRARGRREGDQRVQVQVVSADNPTPITKEEITRVYADR